VKAIAIVGTRNPEGQTARATDALTAGMANCGVEVETVFLTHLGIRRCQQCDDRGWGTCRTEGRCQLEDDFTKVVERLRSADTVIFATPVYFGDLSESMRAFTDRLRRICTHEAGRQGIEGKPALAICVAGGGGGGGPTCAVTLDKVLRTCGLDLVDVIPVRRQNLEFKLGILRETGRWLASETR